MSVIDLDRPAVHGGPERRAPQTFIVAALIVGVVIGGAVTYGWNLRRHSAARDGEVSVLLFADAREMVDSGSIVLHGRVASVTLARRVTLVNVGPAPVNIRNLSAGRPGVTVRGVEKQRWVAPGVTAQADVDVQVDCLRGLPLGRIPVTLSVQTLDEHSRTARPKAAFDGTPWSEQAETACAGN
ncbi:hypothetical protein ACFQFC_20850 [Amorphoplanes digitatis]|uniref:Uncharacterized protein n=1 Tax=Actinoplanes digitatis TaxID=1868 RepID=A0A7W7I5R1_9ACTN|nr:hypothetical protein [Actinoplanes digitatis]MBB4766668.1 hypothetical protein [Actinoplanes digitatis]GID96170.1 hypothetical protein Adi01nite_55820 [Actinoplanes digitatis]